nr:unnamed protein product [Callosobruchus chinensis]
MYLIIGMLIVEKSVISRKQDKVIIYETIGSKSFSCYICDYTATSKNNLIDHMNVHDNKDSCTANAMEKSIISRKQHQDIYDKLGSGSFSCYICNYTAFSKRHLIDHMIAHDNKKNVPDHANRDHCDADASVSNNHVIRKIYACPKCAYKTSFKYSFQQHTSMTTHPESVSRFISYLLVKVCFLFSMEKSIISRKQHQDIYKTLLDSGSFSCYICNYSAFSKRHLIDHMIVHDNKEGFPIV